MKLKPLYHTIAFFAFSCIPGFAAERTSENWNNANDHWVFDTSNPTGADQMLDLSWLNADDINPNGFITYDSNGDFTRADGSRIRLGYWQRCLEPCRGWFDQPTKQYRR